MNIWLELKLVLVAYLVILVFQRKRRLNNDLLLFPPTYGMSKYKIFKIVVYGLFLSILAYHAFIE